MELLDLVQTVLPDPATINAELTVVIPQTCTMTVGTKTMCTQHQGFSDVCTSTTNPTPALTNT